MAEEGRQKEGKRERRKRVEYGAGGQLLPRVVSAPGGGAGGLPRLHQKERAAAVL